MGTGVELLELPQGDNESTAAERYDFSGLESVDVAEAMSAGRRSSRLPELSFACQSGMYFVKDLSRYLGSCLANLWMKFANLKAIDVNRMQEKMYGGVQKLGHKLHEEGRVAVQALSLKSYDVLSEETLRKL